MALSCGDTVFLGYLAGLVMILNIGMMGYNVLKQLLSRIGEENYIDYLCSYAAHMDINVVASILEKWTI